MVDRENMLQEIEDMGTRHLEACISCKELAGEQAAGKGWIGNIKNARRDVIAIKMSLHIPTSDRRRSLEDDR